MAAPARIVRARPLAATAYLCTAVLLLAGCGQDLTGGLRSAGLVGKPDEFMVLPTRPLEMPTSVAELPPPSPGSANRVDYNPHAEAIAGLAGRPGPAGNAGGEALVASAGPRDPGIRGELAAADVEWRETHHGRLLERWITDDRERVAYRQMILNAPAEFERSRALGVGVPAAPPRALE